MYVCMYVRMYVCMYVCMYTCMYVCMYVCTHVCTVPFACNLNFTCVYNVLKITTQMRLCEPLQCVCKCVSSHAFDCANAFLPMVLIKSIMQHVLINAFTF